MKYNSRIIDKVKMPIMYLDYIFNGNIDGLTQKELDDYLLWEKQILNANNIDSFEIDPDIQEFFSWKNPINNLGCTCVDCTLYFLI